MRHRDLMLASVVVVAAMVVAAVAIAPVLPHGTRLPVHWNAAGVADRFTSAWRALALPPAITAATAGLLALLPRFDPRVAASPGLYSAVWAGTLGVLAMAGFAVIAAANGRAPVPGLHFVALGALLLLVGNQLGKSRPMRFIGIRTPWTRANVDTWIATHRLGGWLMIVAGLGCLAFAAAGAPVVAARYLVAAIVASAVVPAVYSYFDWSWRTPRA